MEMFNFLKLTICILAPSNNGNYCPLSSVNIDANEGFIKRGQSPVLTVMSAGHALHVFINGQLSGNDIFPIHFFFLLSLILIHFLNKCRYCVWGIGVP